MSGIISVSDAIERREKEMEDLILKRKEETKTQRYECWKLEVADLFDKLEKVKDEAQDLWIDSEEFRNWLVKYETKFGPAKGTANWHCVNAGMKQVYSNLDSAMFWLKIILGKED